MTTPQQSQISRVFDAVSRGYDCTTRIRVETGIGTPQVARALLTLLEDKIVERGPLPRGGPGRPGFSYRVRRAARS